MSELLDRLESNAVELDRLRSELSENLDFSRFLMTHMPLDLLIRLVNAYANDRRERNEARAL